MYNTAIAKRKRERKAFIILGPPGAGKSTAVANQLLSEHGALEVDSDIAKARLPEYADGVNAQGVHVESREIVDGLVLPQAIEAGDNLVIPKVGSQGVGGSAEQLLSTLQDAGLHDRGHPRRSRPGPGRRACRGALLKHRTVC